MLARCMPVAYPCRAPSCVPVRVPQSVFRVFLGSGSCCLPLQMRSAPRGGGGKAAAGWKKLGKAYGRRVKIEKIRERYLCSPVREGGLGASSADRGKFIESEEGSPSGAGKSGPLRPGFFVPGRCKERRRKSELYNEEFDPGSG